MNLVADSFHPARDYSPADDGPSATLSLVIGAALRRWRLPVLSVAACLALAAAYLAVTPDSYKATAVLITDTRQTPPSLSQTAQETLTDPAVLESQIEILKSDHIAKMVVDKLHLDADPEFAGGGAGLRVRLTAWLTGQPIRPPTANEREVGAVTALLGKVKVTRTGHSYLAEIAATSLVPAKAARIANAIAEAYIQDQLDGRLQANQRAVSWMGQRVDDVKRGADEAAAAVTRFRGDDAAALAAQDPTATAKLDTLTAAAAAAQSDYAALQNRSLRVAQFVGEQSLPVTEARVLTYAEPPLFRSAPRATVILLLACVGGGVIGAGLIYLRESTDKRLRRPEQIRSGLNLPLAGSLPRVRPGRGPAEGGALPSLFDSTRPWCAATEALRTIKVSVDTAAARHDGGVVIGFVSPWPGEGKSTLTLNMANMLAEVGVRTLVIDADIRKPDLSASLGVGPGPGLANLVGGEVAGSGDAVRRGERFDVLGHGDGPDRRHPFSLLGSRRMGEALADAKRSYDYVLVDLPSLLTSVDAQSVARFVDAFVLVTECGRTTSDDVDRALATSDAVAGRLVAAVLNKARKADPPFRRRVRRRLRSARRVLPA